MFLLGFYKNDTARYKYLYIRNVVRPSVSPLVWTLQESRFGPAFLILHCLLIFAMEKRYIQFPIPQEERFYCSSLAFKEIAFIICFKIIVIKFSIFAMQRYIQCTPPKENRFTCSLSCFYEIKFVCRGDGSDVLIFIVIIFIYL